MSSLTAEGTSQQAFTPSDWTLLLIPAFVWGASFLQIAESLEGFEPGAVTFGRILFGFIALGFVRSTRQRVERKDWPQIVAVAITWMAFPMTLFPIAQKDVSSAVAGMLNGAIPLSAAVVASVLLRRLPGRYQLIGLLGGVIGITCIGIPSLREGQNSARGVILVLIAVASYGVAVNLSVPLTQKYGAVPVFWRCQLVAVVLTAPLGIPAFFKSDFGVRPSLFLLSLGVFGTAVAFLCMVTLAARVGATRGAALTYIEAVLALLLGVVVRGDDVHLIEIIGCALLLGSAWLAGQADRAIEPGR